MHIPATVVGVGSASGAGALCSPLGCLSISALIRAVVFGSSGLLFAAAAFSYVAAARTVCEEERRRVLTEASAFDRFRERVGALEPRRPRQDRSVGLTPQPTLMTDGRGDGLAAVRRSYRETVMAVDHYEEDYGESLARHATEELGPDAGPAVANAGEFSPGLQRVVVGAAASASAEREAFAERLDEELTSLASVRDGLCDLVSESREVASRLDGGFGDLEARWRRLSFLERSVTDIVRARADELGDRPKPNLSEYLYEEMTVPAPVLADAAAAAGVIRDRRRRVERALAAAP